MLQHKPLEKVRRFLCAVLACSSLFFCPFPTPSNAQLSLDGSLGRPGALHGPGYRIPAEVGQQRGGNLYHSFGTFRVHQGESATFTGPATVERILARVTGGQSSTIDGLLRVDIPGADLFMLNPQGVLFGEHARLDVQGSLYVSTANTLRLADGATFSADLQRPGVLSVASPAAFGFLGPQPQAIRLQGSMLNVPPGETIALVSGSVQATGGMLSAPQGQIQIVSVAGAGDIALQDGHTAALAPGVGGNIRLQGTTLTTAGERGGDITLRAGQIHLSAGGFVDSSTRGAGPGGVISIVAAEAVSIHGGSAPSDTWLDEAPPGHTSGVVSQTFESGIGGQVAITAPTLTLNDGGSIAAATFGSGPGGAIALDVKRLLIQNGGRIDSNALGMGAGGTITIKASTAVTIQGQGTDGRPSSIMSETQQQGHGGQIHLSTPTLRIADGANMAVNTLGSGAGGVIVLDLDQLTLSNGGRLESNARGSGSSGMLMIHATDSIALSGQDTQGVFSSVMSQNEATGPGGRVHIATNSLRMSEGTFIAAATFGSGSGGRIRVEVGHMAMLQGGRIDSNTSDRGHSGNVSVQAGVIMLRDGANISASSRGSGDAGNITLTARRMLRVIDSSVATVAAQADGGHIQVSAPMVYMTDSALTASVNGRQGSDGGNVTAMTETMVLQSSRVSADAVAGNGGNITLNAQRVLLADPHSQISASSALGLDGQVNVQTPVSNISGAVVPLPQQFAPDTQLSAERCAVYKRGSRSGRLLVHGRDRVPTTPEDLLPGALLQSGTTSAAPMASQQTISGVPSSLTSAYAQLPQQKAVDDCRRWR